MVEEITAMSKVGKKQQDVLERTSSKSDEQIDEAIEESFPASDPPSYAVPVSPARTGPEPEPKKRER